MSKLLHIFFDVFIPHKKLSEKEEKFIIANLKCDEVFKNGHLKLKY